MTRQLGLAVLALTAALAQGLLFAPQGAIADQPVPDTIAGVVTKIDPEQSRVTLQSSDGKPHEFEGSAETLKDLKVGDRIEVVRRAPPK
jgi:Cu/Ag efflux protein CusF